MQAQNSTIDVSEIARRIRPIISEYGVERAILFGSFARGSASARSDIDLLLIVRTAKRFFDRYEGILTALQSALRERDLDVLIYTPEELDAIAHRPFIARALREGVVVHECREAA